MFGVIDLHLSSTFTLSVSTLVVEVSDVAGDQSFFIFFMCSTVKMLKLPADQLQHVVLQEHLVRERQDLTQIGRDVCQKPRR